MVTENTIKNMCIPSSPVKPTRIHIHKIMPDPRNPENRDHDYIIYSRWIRNSYWKMEIINRTELSLYNRK